MANMKIQGKIIKFQIDSGSTVNVIPRSIVGKMGEDRNKIELRINRDENKISCILRA